MRQLCTFSLRRRWQAEVLTDEVGELKIVIVSRGSRTFASCANLRPAPLRPKNKGDPAPVPPFGHLLYRNIRPPQVCSLDSPTPFPRRGCGPGPRGLGGYAYRGICRGEACLALVLLAAGLDRDESIPPETQRPTGGQGMPCPYGGENLSPYSPGLWGGIPLSINL